MSRYLIVRIKPLFQISLKSKRHDSILIFWTIYWTFYEASKAKHASDHAGRDSTAYKTHTASDWILTWYCPAIKYQKETAENVDISCCKKTSVKRSIWVKSR